ncbi:hypothetical protein A3C91_04260 [Candidatus Azambacteria bacterium RIFCSPHIGHO2_02_FULL_52_12]|uniref:DUF4446 domain-containing protein n=1 Tax=Candidatus Azambacteria bacterium RIFCSPLOWO2_01_FULL_46_25 TaxID=1797298 RepID=A0A1F5BUE4_9BACT|nr:MAG: hypothetical protein A3C91_04260 [Candidatus Azambacteria bacterium RIFCSPHIGHO2_02_FULL_52_12]OGD34192.1 MAG: hypothetical protein A2988_01810 [Candidatus Azambacteria bacterium RIFCSPLOWO2_01_FULL_46_25]OGD36868.1 MAG: hypothetical protein A2850_00890 [Candidatus Azambacteria bacterium RIFCSPHIGHO2_01_FULL_51_74]
MPLSQDTIFAVVVSILVLVFVAQNIVLRRKLKSIFKGGANANLEKTLEAQIKKTEALEQEIKKHQAAWERLQAQLENAIQKVGVTRFNSFDESSANQSFSIAALDGKNNGFVLTNLQMREGGRTYAKSIEKGIPKYKLSQEEEDTVKQAMAKQ